jgi:hypothetical protein
METPLAKFFQFPTIAGMAEMLESTRIETENQQKLEILNILTKLSDEEVDRELDARLKTGG